MSSDCLCGKLFQSLADDKDKAKLVAASDPSCKCESYNARLSACRDCHAKMATITTTSDKNIDHYAVRCDACCARGPRAVTVERAIEMWNRRWVQKIREGE